MDENVVLSIDFTSCSIGVLIFESNFVFGGDFSVRHKLESSGFFHLATMGPSVIYASNEYFKKLKLELAFHAIDLFALNFFQL